MGSKRKIEVLHVKDLEIEPDEDTLQKLYMWVDGIPLSRPKKNMARDFADAVMAAELIHHFLPKLVHLHNYPPANSSNQKEQNWFCLNKKVLHTLKLDLTPDLIRALSQNRTWVMENFMCILREKIDIFMAERGIFRVGNDQDDIDAVAMLDQPEVDQHDSVRRGRQAKFTSPQQRQTQVSPRARKAQISDHQVSPRYRGKSLPPVKRQSPQQHDEPQEIEASKLSARGTVPRELLDEKIYQLEVKNRAIMAMNEKIQKLEQLLTIKDLRIDEMSQKVEELSRIVKIRVK